MHREPDTTRPSWVSLHEAAERLSRYLGLHTRFALNDVLARGLVPVLAMRRDIAAAMLPDRVEGLLAKASLINVASHNDTIFAQYRFASEPDIHQVLSPRSILTLADPEPRTFPLIINLDFDQVWVCWATLMRELRRVGAGPADETAAVLRKLGRWPDSWGPIGSGAADETPHSAEPRDATGRPAPAAEMHKAITEAHDTAEAAPSIDDPLAEYIFARHSCRMTYDALLAEACLASSLGTFRKGEFLAAYQRVYETKPHAPPATGWPLRNPYKERWTTENKSQKSF